MTGLLDCECLHRIEGQYAYPFMLTSFRSHVLFFFLDASAAAVKRLASERSLSQSSNAESNVSFILHDTIPRWPCGTGQDIENLQLQAFEVSLLLLLLNRSQVFYLTILPCPQALDMRFISLEAFVSSTAPLFLSEVPVSCFQSITFCFAMLSCLQLRAPQPDVRYRALGVWQLRLLLFPSMLILMRAFDLIAFILHRFNHTLSTLIGELHFLPVCTCLMQIHVVRFLDAVNAGNTREALDAGMCTHVCLDLMWTTLYNLVSLYYSAEENHRAFQLCVLRSAIRECGDWGTRK